MKKSAISVAVILVVSVLSGPVLAQENPEQKPPKAKDKKNSSSDDDFLKELVPDIPLGGGKDGEDGQSSEADELDRTVKAMRQVGTKLDEGDTSDETRDLQTAILDDIDALIEKLKNPPPQQSKPNQKPPQDQSQNPQQKPEHPGEKPNSQPKTLPGQQPQPKPGAEQTGSGGGKTQQKNENKGAGESTEDARQKAQARATALARRRALINEFWGHLRPSVREKLLNVGSEKMLPHYEELIRRYYESLTDSGASTN